MKMNVKSLNSIIRWIQRVHDPRHFDMSNWVERNDCGTSFCIAGKAIDLSGQFELKFDELENGEYFVGKNNRTLKNHHGIAAKLLGLNFKQAKKLFYTSNWPRKFIVDPDASLDDETTPKLAVKRIRHFIKTKGAE